MNQPDLFQLTSENRFPDCVLMKLHAAPVEPEQPIGKPQQRSIILPSGTQATVATTEEISLKLTIRFYKQTIKVPGGKVEFGIRRGTLDLKLTNGRIPLEKTGLTAPFELEIEVEEQQEKGLQSEAAISVAAVGVKTADASKVATKTKSRRYRVANRGTEENPIWEFSMDPHLTGKLTEEPLGTVERNGQPCSVEATFTVRSQTDIQLFNATGLIKAKNLSRNKTALLAREFFLRFIAPRLQPYLSCVEGHL